MSQTTQQTKRGTKNNKETRIFQFAPIGWNTSVAERIAAREGITMTDAHWQVVHALQTYFNQHENVGLNARELHDALDERFHHAGGMRQLFRLFPGGPIAQGCRIAGLHPPTGAVDMGFGSVM